MYEAVAAAGVGLVATYGVAVLLVVFALEGALVGKLIPTRALFVGTVLALGTDVGGIASTILAAVVGATVGQLVVFALVRRTGVSVEILPGAGDSATSDRLRDWFDRWGLPAFAVSNALPVARGSLIVPAAMTDADAVRFSSAAVVGTAIYAGGLVAIAAGLELILATA